MGLSVISDVLVALDLETTGLDSERDEIIEIGAVRFQDGIVLDTYRTFVNPGRSLPSFVSLLTGIAADDLYTAPTFGQVAGDLRDFVGDAGIVGHNVSFDLAFLRQKGLRFSGPVYDTLEMALILYPRAREHNLVALGESFGLRHENAHRALDDALVSMGLFNKLLARAQDLRPETLHALAPLLRGREWPFGRILTEAARGAPAGNDGPAALAAGIRARMEAEERARTPRQERLIHEAVNPDRVASLLGPDGPLARALSAYEDRPQQRTMAHDVASALNDGETLLVEAGAGTGKSLAYLVPALSVAVANGTPVAVSTSTRGLQEQLVVKDLPTALTALGLSESDVRVAVLKGQGNYLCLHRFLGRLGRQDMSIEEVRFLVRLSVWLEESISGDQGEINLWPQDLSLWDQLHAGGGEDSGLCPFRRSGACFLNRARRLAQDAHLVVTNHAFLLADAARGGKFLSHVKHLVLDEAHNLEAEATNQFGDRLGMMDVLRPLYRVRADGDDSLHLADRARLAVAARSLAPGRLQTVESAGNDVQAAAARAVDRSSTLFDLLDRLINVAATGREDVEPRVRLVPSVRTLPQWTEALRAWEDLEAMLNGLDGSLDRLNKAVEDVEDEALLADLAASSVALREVLERLRAVLTPADQSTVCWLGRRGRDVALERAPLHTGPLLQEHVFSGKDAVVLTSATMCVSARFDYVKAQLGVTECRERILGSAFDYKASSAVFAPRDMPTPDAPGYQRAVERALTDVAAASDGHGLALFTSYASLRAAYTALKRPLEERGILVLAQGIDGQPARLLQAFRNNPKALLLGAGTFWEGVDLGGADLRLLVITRLPFRVPTDPIVAARSESYDDPFNQYALPETILRFRQGFGRLIRTNRDQGVVVILDGRVVSKSYGRAFLDALPGLAASKPTLRDLASEVSSWLDARIS